MIGADKGSTAKKSAVAGWILYDLANSIFAVSVIAVYFPIWLTADLKGSDGSLAAAFSLATALAVISSPVLGAWSDRIGRRMPFLVVTTLISLTFTALLGTRSVPLALGFYVVASYFFQSGVVFYDALLPTVSTEKTRGRIGGLGVGLSSLGALLALGAGVIAPQLVGETNAKPLTFVMTGGLFLLFALPCFLLVKERRAEVAGGGTHSKEAMGQLRATFSRARTSPGIIRYLIGRAFYTDAINTLFLFITIYVTKELGLTQRQAEALFLVGVVAPIIGGIVGGRLTDRWGPKRSLELFLLMWVASLSLTASLAYLDSFRGLIWVASMISGIAFGGTYASDRPLLLRLTPPQYIGEFFGLHNMAGRFSAIIGPLLWTAIAEGMGLGRPMAMASLALLALTGYAFVRAVPEPKEAHSVAAPATSSSKST